MIRWQPSAFVETVGKDKLTKVEKSYIPKKKKHSVGGEECPVSIYPDKVPCKWLHCARRLFGGHEN